MIIRSQTNRPNLFHHVLHLNSEVHKNGTELISNLAHMLEEKLFSHQSRGIIFCTSIHDVERIAPLFQGTMSHSDMDVQARLKIQEEWFQGINRKWMVATTGFLHGIDHPGVDAVIFLELPYGLMNYVQGAGRSGRSNQPSHIFLLTFDTLHFIEPRHVEEDCSCRIAGNEFQANTTKCRLLILSQTMDGIPMSCGDIYRSIGCDICKPEDPIVIASKKLLDPPRSKSPEYPFSEWSMDELQTLDEVQDVAMNTSASLPATHSVALQNNTSHQSAQSSSSLVPIRSMALHMDHSHYSSLISDKKAKVVELTEMTKIIQGPTAVIDSMINCVICWAWKDKFVRKTKQHSYFLSCRSKSDHFIGHAIGWIDQCKKQLKIERYKYCHQCGLPQGDFMPSTHPSFKKGESMRCPFDDLVAVLLWHIIHDESILRKVKDAFPALESISGSKAIVQWMAKEESPTKFYNGLEVVVWYWLTFKKGKN